MNDMSRVILPKSNQINADSMLAGPLTITITKVSVNYEQEQPVSIRFEGDGGKPYKPCKSMARVMVHCWGADASEYIGRSMTLFCDPKVTWGGMAVGGIRISHMSHINAALTMALTMTKGDKKPFTVKPLKIEQRAPVAADASADPVSLLAKAEAAASLGVAAYQAFWKAATKQDREALVADHANLKAQATEADAEAERIVEAANAAMSQGGDE